MKFVKILLSALTLLASANAQSLGDAGNRPVQDVMPTVVSKSHFKIRPTDTRVLKHFADDGRSLTLKGSPLEQVKAVGDGRVVWAGNGLKGYGNLIIVKHDDSFLTAYSESRTILVQKGDAVAEGQPIADMGETLKFEVRLNGKAVDPEIYLPPF
jgi:hypothetical protein